MPLCRICHDYFHNNPLKEREKLRAFYLLALNYWLDVYDPPMRELWRGIVDYAESSTD